MTARIPDRFPTAKILIEAESLSVTRRGKKILSNAGVRVRAGEIVTLIGPNGAGKTTFCDLVSGKTPPTTGQVFFDRDEITGVQEVDIARRGIGRKFQTPTVFDSLTTFENLELSLPGRQGLWSNLLHATTPEEAGQIEALLERVRLIDERDTEASQLSHGQRQWLAISALILTNPKLLLVDEPTASLDPKTSRQIMRLIVELAHERGTPALVNIHDVALAQASADRIVALKEGRTVFDGAPDALSPQVLTDIYGEEDWSATIRRGEDEDEGDGKKDRIKEKGFVREASAG